MRLLLIFALVLVVGCDVRRTVARLQPRETCVEVSPGGSVALAAQAVDTTGAGVDGVPVSWRLANEGEHFDLVEQETLTATADFKGLAVSGVVQATVSAKDSECVGEITLLANGVQGAVLAFIRLEPDGGCASSTDGGVQ